MRKSYYTGTGDYSDWAVVKPNDVYEKSALNLIDFDYIALYGFGET